MNNYANIQEGALGLLYETTLLLNRIGVKYIIVGGWAPYLLNSNPIPHPGTKDVDILFDGAYEKGGLKQVIQEFLENDFILSAKHDFQLFKEIKINGKSFIYNVDLLHPLETINPKDIYVEHIDLDIPANKYQSDTFKLKSIALPSSQSLFDNNIIFNYELTIETSDGEKLTQCIPLMGELGTLITKSRSVKVDKRYRDSFDIYITIMQSKDYGALIDSVKKIKKSNRDTYNTLYGIKEAYETGILEKNTLKYVSDLNAEDFNLTLEKFFEDSELNELATS